MVGLGKDEHFLASDVSAIVAHTKDVIYLNDYDESTSECLIRCLKLDDGKELTFTVEVLESNIAKETAAIERRYEAERGTHAPSGLLAAVAGDHRDTASIQGAMVSGRRAADAALAHLGVPFLT